MRTFLKIGKQHNRVICPKCEGEGYYIGVFYCTIGDIFVEKEMDLDCELCETSGFIYAKNDNGHGRVIPIH